MTKDFKYLKCAIEKGYTIDKEGNVFSGLGKRITQCEQRKMNGTYLYFNIRLPISFNEGRKVVHIFTHRFQALHKFGDSVGDESLHVRHLDNNPSNNHWDNIGIGSPSENMMDKLPETRKRAAVAASNKVRKFTDRQMEEIREFYKLNKSYKLTMEKFNITSTGSLHHMLNVEYQTTK